MAKSKYESQVLPRLDEVEAWARDGVSDEQIAGNLGIAYSTFRIYKEKYPALSAALRRGKEYVDRVIVVGAYLRRITGYDVTETRREYKWVYNDETGERDRIIVKEIQQTRHIPGDPRAAEFWLANRQRQEWKRNPTKEEWEEKEEDTGVILLPEVTENG